MERITYRIVSKRKKMDGTPEFSKSGTTASLTSTINFHQWGLINHCHPDPDMTKYAFHYGPHCFEYIVDPVEQAIIEQAIIIPEKETRKIRKKPE